MEGVRTPKLRKMKELKLASARNKCQFKNHVIRCHWETWNDVGRDYEVWPKNKR